MSTVSEISTVSKPVGGPAPPPHSHDPTQRKRRIRPAQEPCVSCGTTVLLVYRGKPASAEGCPSCGSRLVLYGCGSPDKCIAASVGMGRFRRHLSPFVVYRGKPPLHPRLMPGRLDSPPAGAVEFAIPWLTAVNRHSPCRPSSVHARRMDLAADVTLGCARAAAQFTAVNRRLDGAPRTMGSVRIAPIGHDPRPWTPDSRHVLPR